MNLSFVSRETIFLAAVASLLAVAVAGLWGLATNLTAHYKARHYLAHIALMTERTRGAYITGRLRLAPGDADRALNAAGLVPKVFLAADTSGKLTDLWSNPLSIVYAPTFRDSTAGLVITSSLDNHNCRALVSVAAPSISNAAFRLGIDDMLFDAPADPDMIHHLCKRGRTRIAFEVSITPPLTPSSSASP